MSCEVTDPTNQYNFGGSSQTIDVEVSSPTATATPARAPDSNGWYNHPVGISFAGRGYSGAATCAPATSTYSGPDTPSGAVTSTCTDPAGKTVTASVPLKYDSTPPTITGATPSRPPDSNGYYTHPVTFQFTGVDGVSGIASCDAVTYSGPSSGAVVGGCHDNAGNYAAISVPVQYQTPTATQTATAAQAATPTQTATLTRTATTSVARVGSSLRLSWKKASHATYYNVQVFRGKKKILSTWPSKASLLLRRTWKFAGHRYTLKAGSYHWYVWPGYGSRSSARYGKRMVSGTFKVAKLV